MLELKEGSVFDYCGTGYKVVAEKEYDECKGCAFTDERYDDSICDILDCEGTIIEAIALPKLVIAFRRMENILIFKVVSQDEDWYRVSEGYIKSRLVPSLEKDELYIRGLDTAYDNVLNTLTFNSAMHVLKTYQDIIANLGTKYDITNRYHKGSWELFELTI